VYPPTPDTRTDVREVVAPAYVPYIAMVQVYWAFAQVLFRDAGFFSPVKSVSG
jgi:hypothetical protein